MTKWPNITCWSPHQIEYLDLCWLFKYILQSNYRTIIIIIMIDTVVEVFVSIEHAFMSDKIMIRERKIVEKWYMNGVE